MKSPRQLPLHLPVQPNYAAISFIQNQCNEESLQLINAWPAWTGKMSAIYGPRGCGKTHLAHIWQEKSGARFITRDDISHFTPTDIITSASAFILDDADEIFQSTENHEQWLFHFYNLVREQEVFLLLCCFQPPARWPVKLPDLQSRLSTIVSVAVHMPDETALRTIVYKLCSERGLILSSDMADYILRRIERSFEAASVTVEKLNHYALSTRRQLTPAVVREILAQPEFI